MSEPNKTTLTMTPKTSPSAAPDGRRTLVEEGTHFKGSLTSSFPIEVKGRVEGDLTAPALLVSATGSVEGRVKVGEVRSQGELAGEIDADLVAISGTVKDSTVIRAKSLDVKLSPGEGTIQVVFGNCRLEVGQPAAHDPALARAPLASAPPIALPLAAATPSAATPAEPNGV